MIAARANAVGMDGIALLKSSRADSLVLQALAEETIDQSEKRDKSLAALIINALSKSLKT